MKAVLAPLVWLLSIVVVSLVVRKTNAIELGILITVGVMAVSAVVLLFLRHRRDRQRARYADRR